MGCRDTLGGSEIGPGLSPFFDVCVTSMVEEIVDPLAVSMRVLIAPPTHAPALPAALSIPDVLLSGII
jgi:hypothetical protein